MVAEFMGEHEAPTHFARELVAYGDEPRLPKLGCGSQHLVVLKRHGAHQDAKAILDEPSQVANRPRPLGQPTSHERRKLIPLLPRRPSRVKASFERHVVETTDSAELGESDRPAKRIAQTRGVSLLQIGDGGSPKEHGGIEVKGCGRARGVQQAQSRSALPRWLPLNPARHPKALRAAPPSVRQPDEPGSAAARCCSMSRSRPGVVHRRAALVFPDPGPRKIAGVGLEIDASIAKSVLSTFQK